jgi:hypothetical protein
MLYLILVSTHTGPFASLQLLRATSVVKRLGNNRHCDARGRTCTTLEEITCLRPCLERLGIKSVDILISSGKHFSFRLMSLTVEDSALKTNITAPPFIEIPVQSHGSERSCMCMSVRDIDLASFPTIDINYDTLE